MPRLEIKVCQFSPEKNNNMEKFNKFCRDSLSKKKGTKFQVIPGGAMIEANKIILFKILRELDKYSVPVRTIKKAAAKIEKIV
jgi:hypothetical protein